MEGSSTLLVETSTRKKTFQIHSKREKKDLAVVTQSIDIQTKMIFVESKTCLSG